MGDGLALFRENWGWTVEAALVAGGAAALLVWARRGIGAVLIGLAWYIVARLGGAGPLAVLGPLGAAAWVGAKCSWRRAVPGVPDVDALVGASASLSKACRGALIVVERTGPLADFLASGTRLDAVAGKELLQGIFAEGSPLRNGAAVVRGGRVEAAGCLLPLSENPDLSKSLGTRRRAALGISERTDAVAVVVSGETGAISVALKGELMQGLSVDDLRHVLADLFEA